MALFDTIVQKNAQNSWKKNMPELWFQHATE